MKTRLPFSVDGYDPKLTAGAVANIVDGCIPAANLAKAIEIVVESESEMK